MGTATETATKNTVTLKGSAEMVSKFFYYGINSILYQRGLYPPEDFKRTQEYGLTLLLTADTRLDDFLKTLLDRIRGFLAAKELQKLVLVICSTATKEVLERWQFDIHTDKDVTVDGPGSTRQKDEKQINHEIRDVIRQITASVTFLPLLECACSFDVLIYTGKETETPNGWEESGPRLIFNSEDVRLRSFSTSVHSVDTCVSYKNPDV